MRRGRLTLEQLEQELKGVNESIRDYEAMLTRGSATLKLSQIHSYKLALDGLERDRKTLTAKIERRTK